MGSEGALAGIIQREVTHEEENGLAEFALLSSTPAVADRERGREDVPAAPAEGGDYAPGLLGRLWRVWRAGTDAMLRPFIVPSSSGNNLAFLDSLRGVAVLLVVIYHSWVFSGEPNVHLAIPGTGGAINLTPILFNGSAGVQLFFVLSAFLLSQPWLRADYRGQPRPSLRRYLRHRFFRIVPAYYCCLFLMLLLLVPAFIPITAVYSRDGARMLGIHLLFMQYFFPFTASSYGVNGSLWTLTIEMTLYLLLPWAVVLFLRKRWLLVMPILLAVNLLWLRVWAGFSAPALAVIHYEEHLLPGASDANIRYFLARQFPCHLVTFGLGIVLANLFVRHQLALGRGRAWRIGTHPWAGAAYFVAGWIFLFWGMQKVEYDTTLRYG